jgi:ribonuclease T2
MLRFLCATVTILFFATAAFADGSCQAPASSDIQAQACAKDGKSKGKAGKFDYYALVLGWSPHHCRGKDVTDADNFQCKTNRFGFVVDGLWPVRNNGKLSQYCAGSSVPARPAELVAETMCTIPNANAVQCAWKKQGTCTGLDDEAYFATVRELYAGLHFPPEFQQPFINDKVVKASDFIDAMIAANPSLKPENIGLICEGGGVSNTLEKITVCYDSDLKPNPCGRVPDACRAAEVKFYGLR